MGFKTVLRSSLDFLLTLAYFGNPRLMFSLIKGWGLSSYGENQLLFKCARNGWGEGLIVEIGSYMGRSTKTLARGSKSKKREKVYAIDPLEDPKIRETFCKNIKAAKIEDYVISDFRKSDDVAREFNSAVRFLFVDGSHTYEDAKNDILIWKEFLIDGGIIAVHDYFPKGHLYYRDPVTRAVDECIVNSSEFIVEAWVDCTLVASKNKSKNSFFSRFDQFNKLRESLKAPLNKSFLKMDK